MVSPTLELLAVMAQDLARRNEGAPNMASITTQATKSRRRAAKYLVPSAPIQHFPIRAPQFFTGGIQPRRAAITIVRGSYGCEPSPSVSDCRWPERGVQRSFLPPAKVVFNKRSAWVFSFLVYAQNQNKNWLYELMDALDPAGPLQLKASVARPQHRSHSRVDLLYKGQHCWDHAPSR